MKKGKKKHNTFKFKNFAERISDVKIDVYQHLGVQTHEVPENDKDTFFRETLEKWSELNCSLDFTAFYREVKGFVQSFNQLVFHKEAVIELLKKYLINPESLAVEPSLDLLAQLSRDLLQDFYPYFEEFFYLLLNFLKGQDTALIENTFTCLAHIFKFTWRYMITDLPNVFRIFKCLFSSDQKQHIQIFAAESFAFLLRKSRNKSQVFDFLFQQLSDDESLAEGIGFLIFHTTKGIKQQFSSSAKEIFTLSLLSFTKESIQKKQALTAVKSLLRLSLQHTTEEFCGVVFDSIYKAIDDEVNKENSLALSYYALVLNECVKFKDGKYIAAQDKIYKVMLALMSSGDFSEEITEISISKLLTSFIHYSTSDISDKDLTALCYTYVFKDQISVSIKLQFCYSIFTWVKFNEIVLGTVLEYVSKILLSKDENEHSLAEQKVIAIQFIADFVSQDKSLFTQPFKFSNTDLIVFHQVCNTNQTVVDILIDELSAESLDSNIEWIGVIAICLCHSRLSHKEVRRLIPILVKIVNCGFDTKSNLSDQQLFTLAYVIKVLCKVVSDKNEICRAIPVKKMINFLRKYPRNENVLQCAELYCSTVKNSFIQDNLSTIHDILKTNLYSPFRLVRLLTLMILKHISDNIEGYGRVMSETLQICTNAELVDVRLDTYRDRLIYLRQLQFNNSEGNQFLNEVALRYLVGNLFINFSIIWDHVIEVISSHAGDGNIAFWDIWREILQDAAQKCEFPPKLILNVPCSNKTFEKYFNLMWTSRKNERPDFLNFRILVWKAMCSFPGVAERKSRDIVPLFFNFMTNEYVLSDEILSETQDIRVEEDTLLKVAEEENQVTNEVHKLKGFRKMKLKSLCAHLKLFGLFKDPKSISKEKRLFQIYLDLLTNKDNEVQTLALHCFHTYKFPYLKPYTENLDKLMNDSTFRDELTLFSSNSELLQKEHREKLMPILIRLLYGKLQRKTGLGNSGKSSLSTRRNIIMQFLSNCADTEIKTFIDLIMKPFLNRQELTITDKDASIDLSSIVPMRKQTGFLNMLSNVISRLTKIISPYFHVLFSTLLKLIWECSMCLKDKKDMIKPSVIGRLKDTRHLGIMKLVEIFNLLPEFDYQHYIEEIFAAAVWPQLNQMVSDSVQNATPLFHLVITWSKNNRFHPLLCKVNDKRMSLVGCVYEMIKQPSLSNEMEKEIMLISSNLLKASNFVETGMNGTKIETESSFTEKERLGIKIIKPYVSELLKYLSNALLTNTKRFNFRSKQKIGRIVPPIQLAVLSSISEFVTDTGQCNVLIKILFPLLQYIDGEDTQLHIVTTIKNLLPFVESTEEYLQLIPCLFSVFSARVPREVLCQVYVGMSKNNAEISKVAALVNDLNAWDPKRLDEPDYDRRLQAFRNINACVKSNSWSCKQVLPIMFNTLHFMITTDDLSLRDASSSCIEKLLHLVVQNMDDMFNEVVMKTLLPAIKLGLKSKKQATRLEFINLLSLVVKTFDKDSFNDMKFLSSNDPETDFFENIKHIQVHRRIRALHQLSKLCEDQKLSVSNMFSFLIPMISHVIFDSLATTKDHNLLSETITTIGSIVKCLPWAKYSHILKNYLKVMRKDKRNQKTIIRVIVVILNNFNFDLSCLKADGDQVNEKTVMQQPAVEKTTEKKVEEESGENDDDNDEDDDDVDVDDDENETINKRIDSQSAAIGVEAAQRIHNALLSKIFPQLQSFLKKKSRIADFHKMSHNKEEDEEEIMKVPMALAMVKLLQHLPKATLHVHLPGLLLRVSQALRSHARDVRDMARDTLKRICQSLSAAYFPMVVKEMRSVLLRGYQLHILGYTLHSLLESMHDMLVTGDLDNCVEAMMEVVIEELYGEVSEEKNVAGITGKLMEARSHKSNESLEIIAKFVSSGCIGKVITPLKGVLESTQNHKTSRKVEESLRRVALGLQNNKGVQVEDLLVFIHGIISNTLPQMLNRKEDSDHSDRKEGEYVREDIYLVPEIPTRGGKLPGVSKITNEHVVMEFGLQLLHTGLKRQKFSRSDDTHVKMLDPFVRILLSSITSKYIKVIILTMRCISFLIKFPLPSMKESAPILARQLFKILKKYAKAGAGKGENFDLVMTSFKTMTVLIRDYEDMHVTNKQLHLLLSFVEEDIYDTSRQSTALPLLKAILSRKLVVPEMHEVMAKIAELSVRDSDDVTRTQCRQLMLQYMLDYPLGKKIVHHLNFYVTHLSYEDLVGRLSTLEMLSSIVKNFPERMILEYAGYFFIPLVMMLVNDDSTVCRKMAAGVVRLLIQNSDSKIKDQLFDMVVTWSQQEKILLKQVSLQIAGMFVEAEGQSFQRRIDSILPVITSALQTGVEDDNNDEDDDEEEEQDAVGNNKSADKLLHNALTCLGKIFMLPELLMTNSKYSTSLICLWELIQDLLLHSHVWIRLAASQLYSLYFASSTPNELVASSESLSKQYLAVDLKTKVKGLCSNFFTQMKDIKLTPAIAEQATKNLIYLVKVVKLIDPYLLDGTQQNDNRGEDEEEDDDGKVITVKTLVTRMNQLASYESSHSPKQTVKRTCVFRWIAALCLDLHEEQLLMYLPDLLRPVHRELTTSINEDSDLFKLAQEVIELIRGTVRKDLFAEVYAKLQKKVSEVKESRKRKIAMEAVSNPEKHVLRKQKHNLAKREQRKRKLYEQKPSLMFKKIRSKPES